MHTEKKTLETSAVLRRVDSVEGTIVIAGGVVEGHSLYDTIEQVPAY